LTYYKNVHNKLKDELRLVNHTGFLAVISPLVRLRGVASKWAVDQVIEYAIAIHVGIQVMEYMKLAYGTCAPTRNHRERR